MSTVLWANQLVNEAVSSDASDKYALYKYTNKLDAICRRVCKQSFKDLCDTTDLVFNLTDKELPQGMTTTDELMAVDGKWTDAADAVNLLSAAIKEIEAKNIRFGLFTNDHDAVVAELKESLTYAQDALAKGGKFNFSVVM